MAQNAGCNSAAQDAVSAWGCSPVAVSSRCAGGTGAIAMMDMGRNSLSDQGPRSALEPLGRGPPIGLWALGCSYTLAPCVATPQGPTLSGVVTHRRSTRWPPH